MLTYAIPNDTHFLHLTYMLTALLSVIWVIGFMLLEDDTDFFGSDKSFDDEFTDRPSDRNNATSWFREDV
jgi:hypothetical protein